jgi:SAM-dependent methyltransferase
MREIAPPLPMNSHPDCHRIKPWFFGPGGDRMRIDEVAKFNQVGWDRRVEERDVWTRPVSTEEIEHARSGDWSVVLTPNKPVPREWFGDIVGKRILCLASGGGQQGPILAAAGGQVVVFDASAKQLAQDIAVARRDGLSLATHQGFMHDLSVFADNTFDIIFHPTSNCYAPDIEPVWRECFRVLRNGGALLSGFMNPIAYIFDPEAQERGELVVRFRLPYADILDLPAEELGRLIEGGQTVEFSHTLERQIGGQLKAGFLLTHLFEDTDYEKPETVRSRHFPPLLATRAVKPGAVLPGDQ